MADYIVVGGGLTGCVIASRLKQYNPTLSVIVLEAGPGPESKHDITTPMGGFALQGSELDWQSSTKPRIDTDGRIHTVTAGKTLGGGSILNYGGWSRGDIADYDTWSRLIGSKQWSYENLLPYFKRSECFDPTDQVPPNTPQRGLSGPMKITSVGASSEKRRYPLRKPLYAAWEELGVDTIAYGCTGRNQGLSEWLENWDGGRRQSAYHAYPLDGVQVLSSTPVTRVLFAETAGGSKTQSKRVTGVLLQSGQKLHAHREVLLCAGAIQSPVILMASGVGPQSILSNRHIPVIRELPGVGANMIDHFALFQLFKLRPSDRGLALGHSDLEDPEFFLGLPTDCVVNEGLPCDLLKKALDKDGTTGAERDALLEPNRCFLEYLVLYHPLSSAVPADGTYISTSVMLTLPSSRGRVSLADGVETLPTIEPSYLATALDYVALIYGVRRILQLMLATKALEPYVYAEIPPPGLPPLYPGSSDAEIESRIRSSGIAHFHTMGTCALGPVLDAEMRVRGVQGLRVCDASALPSSVGGHPQATLCGMAEMAAEMIIRESKLD